MAEESVEGRCGVRVLAEQGGRCYSMRRYGLWPDAANTSSQQAEEHTEGGRDGGC